MCAGGSGVLFQGAGALLGGHDPGGQCGCLALPAEIKGCEVVGKLNQKDHAQGHICPNVQEWLEKGPAGLLAEAREKLAAATEEKKEFYRTTELVLEGAIRFMERYAELAEQLAESCPAEKAEEKKTT